MADSITESDTLGSPYNERTAPPTSLRTAASSVAEMTEDALMEVDLPSKVLAPLRTHGKRRSQRRLSAWATNRINKDAFFAFCMPLLTGSAELFFKTLTMFLFAADLDFQMLDVARDASTWVRTLEYAIMIQNTLFPYVTTYHIIGMLEEFLLREWFYYRLMEYGLLLDLRDRERMKHFFEQSGMFWYVFVSVRARVETG